MRFVKSRDVLTAIVMIVATNSSHADQSVDESQSADNHRVIEARSEDGALITTEEYEELKNGKFAIFQLYPIEMVGRKLVKVQGRFNTDGDCRIEQVISPDPVIQEELGKGWSHVSHAIAKDLDSCQTIFERGFVPREKIEKLLGLPPLLEKERGDIRGNKGVGRRLLDLFREKVVRPPFTQERVWHVGAWRGEEGVLPL